ncbi:hypothetical protein [Deinococcus sonorensis]|uniref:Uncharacterized protein n=2 Tax=Deinococcus sonorensis TaxID=309891 RepID=A0AAU7UE95_9DEIO
MSAFQLGDRVQITGDGQRLPDGAVGVITELGADARYRVATAATTAEFLGMRGVWIAADRLRLVRAAPGQPRPDVETRLIVRETIGPDGPELVPELVPVVRRILITVGSNNTQDQAISEQDLTELLLGRGCTLEEARRVAHRAWTQGRGRTDHISVEVQGVTDQMLALLHH